MTSSLIAGKPRTGNQQRSLYYIKERSTTNRRRCTQQAYGCGKGSYLNEIKI